MKHISKTKRIFKVVNEKQPITFKGFSITLWKISGQKAVNGLIHSLTKRKNTVSQESSPVNYSKSEEEFKTLLEQQNQR